MAGSSLVAWTALLAAIAMFLPGPSIGDFVEQVRTASLNGHNVLPRGGGSGYGTTIVSMEYDRLGQAVLDLEYALSLPNIPGSGIRGIAIHKGNRNQVGPKLYEYSSGGGISASLQELFVMEAIDAYTVDQQIQDFLDGLWYIEVETDLHPDGSLRGQLLHTDRAYARLSSEFTVPISSGSNQRGVLLATYSPWKPANLLDIDVAHTVVGTTSSALYAGGTAGQNGERFSRFSQTDNTLNAAVTLSRSQEQFLLSERMYFQVNSHANPSGDIRGQLITIDMPSRVAFTSQLVSDDEDRNLFGCALVTYQCQERLMEVFVVHNLDQSGTVLDAFVTDGNDVALPLNNAKSPIYHAMILDDASEYQLYSQQLSVEVRTAEVDTDSDGDDENDSNYSIRGLISIGYDFFAYITGTQVVPPVTTSRIGCANLRLTNNNRNFNYWIQHNVGNATRVDLWRGQVGQPGWPINELSTTNELHLEGQAVLDDDDLFRWVDGQTYVQINDAQHPFGLLRGQVLRVDPCIAQGNGEITEE